VCNEREDYANEIEPSSAGGKKIAAAVWKTVSGGDFKRNGEGYSIFVKT
jgi:hypothetical protein